MLSHTPPLAGRDPRALRLQSDEAFAMHDKGFRFSIFDPRQGLFNVSIPYQTVEDRNRGTVTFMQPDGAD